MVYLLRMRVYRLQIVHAQRQFDAGAIVELKHCHVVQASAHAPNGYFCVNPPAHHTQTHTHVHTQFQWCGTRCLKHVKITIHHDTAY